LCNKQQQSKTRDDHMQLPERAVIFLFCVINNHSRKLGTTTCCAIGRTSSDLPLCNPFLADCQLLEVVRSKLPKDNTWILA